MLTLSPHPALAIHLLGGLRIIHRQQPLPFAALPRTASLLAFLLLRQDEWVPRAQLAFTLWPDLPEDAARANLRRHLYDLQRAIPAAPDDRPWVHSDSRALCWPARPEFWLDINAFTSAFDAGQLDAAVTLYGGDFLPHLDDEWAIPIRTDLHQRFVRALATLIDRADRANDPHQAIVYARRLLACDPLDEETARRLMALYAATGSRNAALRVYSELARQLSDELGVEPLPETQTLYNQLLEDTAPVAASAPTPLLRLSPPPVAPHPLIGRTTELATATALLAPDAADAQLLTLTGSGGVGKTRLALAVARALTGSNRFPDGIAFVSLADTPPEADLSSRLIAALGVRDDGTAPARVLLAAALRERKLLLLLDNCEHLPNLAPLVADLLAEAPGVRVMATSRTPLGVYGEYLLPVPPLSLPSANQPAAQIQTEAVTLFVSRARAIRPDFTLNDTNAADIAAICITLDGMPLALELAAARLDLLSPAALRARLSQRLDLLTNPARTAHRRQRSLRAAIDWSVSLIPAEARQALARLGVFAGGWSIPLAAMVLADSPVPPHLDALAPELEIAALEVIGTLARASLVVPAPDDDEPRGMLLETIRTYALELLHTTGEQERVREGHGRALLALVTSADLRGAAQGVWLGRIERERENLRAALDWSLQAKPALALELSVALWPFWSLRGPLREGRSYLSQALANAVEPPPPLHSAALYGLGHLAWMQGDYAFAQATLETCLSLQEQNNDRAGMARTLHRLGAIATHRDERGLALARYEAALALWRQLGDENGTADTLNNLAVILQEQHRHDEAEALYREALILYTRSDMRRGMVVVHHNLGELALLRGAFAEAEQHYRASLPARRSLGNQAGLAFGLRGLAEALALQGRALEAAQLWGAEESIREHMGAAIPDSDRPSYDRLVREARAAASAEAFAAAWAYGRARSSESRLDELLGGARE